MKKILLTFGTATAITVPISTVVACGKSSSTTVDDAAIRTALNSETIQSSKTKEQLETVASEKATSAKEANTRFGVASTEFSKITTALGNDWEFVSLDYDTSQSKLKLVYKHKEKQESNKEIHLATKISTINDSSIITMLNGISIVSTKTLTELTNASGIPVTSETDADTNFGIVKDQFDSIITALGGETSNWKFVNIDFDIESSKFKLTYKYSLEQFNREIYLTTTTKKHNNSPIVIALNKLNIISTKTLAELNAAAGTPATTEEEANTRFGIVKVQFDSIITALGGPTSDWKFVNIDFNTGIRVFQLTYKHSDEGLNEIAFLQTTSRADDSEIVIALNKLNIISIKTLTELNAAAGTPATTEEEADTNFGIVKDQFDSIITALGGTSSDWKFVNIDFDTESSKFKLTYKYSLEQFNREIDLTTTVKSVNNL